MSRQYNNSSAFVTQYDDILFITLFQSALGCSVARFGCKVSYNSTITCLYALEQSTGFMLAVHASITVQAVSVLLVMVEKTGKSSGRRNQNSNFTRRITAFTVYCSDCPTLCLLVYSIILQENMTFRDAFMVSCTQDSNIALSYTHAVALTYLYFSKKSTSTLHATEQQCDRSME